MSDAYRVPKRSVCVQVRTAQRDEESVTLFLGERAETHAGPERPIDLLNGPHSFVPAQRECGRVDMIAREQVMLVSVAKKDDSPGPGGSWSDPCDTVTKVAVVLDDGTQLEGTLRYQLPDASRRLQDYLNQPEPFIAVHRCEGMVLVNKRYVAHVSEL